MRKLERMTLGTLSVKRVKLTCLEITDKKISVGDKDYSDDEIVAENVNLESTGAFWVCYDRAKILQAPIYCVRADNAGDALYIVKKKKNIDIIDRYRAAWAIVSSISV